MKLLEYEAKHLLSAHGAPTPRGRVIAAGAPIDDVPVMLKSQVPVGGRGKAGGVVRVETSEEATREAARIFDLEIGGHRPRVLLAEEPLDIAREFYLSLTIDRQAGEVSVLAGREGGVEIESHTTDLFRAVCAPDDVAHIGKELADYLDCDALGLFETLYACFGEQDMHLLEINPLVVTTDGRLVCADAKIELDDAAVFRHDDWTFEAAPADTNFVVLNEQGNVATVANGAGLAMATVDSVAARGMVPANFLDVGGGATAESMTAAFTTLSSYGSVRAIVVNIFAGITRCDEVARAIVAANAALPDLPPLFIRLAGTNYDEAVPILAAAGIPLLPSLADCLDKTAELIT